MARDRYVRECPAFEIMGRCAELILQLAGGSRSAPLPTDPPLAGQRGRHPALSREHTVCVEIGSMT